jgi:hypothetical protein
VAVKNLVVDVIRFQILSGRTVRKGADPKQAKVVKPVDGSAFIET